VFGPEELALAEPHEVLRLHEAAVVEALVASGGELPHVLLSPRVDPAAVPAALRARAGVEVSSRAELDRALATDAPLLVGRGQDVPGVAGELSSFVLFQLLARHADRPYYLTGPAGPLLARAYRAEGVAGMLVPAGARVRPPGSTPYRAAVGDAHAVRLHRDLTPEQAAEDAAAYTADAAGFLRETHAAGLWEPWAEDLGAGEARAWVDRLRALWEATAVGPPGPALFGEDTPYTHRWGSRLALVQGPMSRVSTSPELARAVHEAGAFPYLALAGLSLDEVDAACAGCQEAGTPYGVGIVAIGTPPADFEALVQVLEARRPDRVLVAAPQLDQVDRLRRSDLPLFVHAPVLPIYRSLRDLGLDAFVLEGEEAGGHVSTVGSLALWQDVLEAVAEEPDPGAVTLVFAGGVASAEAAHLISSLVHFAGLAGRTPVALQAGTAYLTTDEAVELGPITEVYRRAVLDGRDTLVTGESLRLRVRQVATPAIAEQRSREREVYTSEMDLEDKKRAIEASYLGSLGRAVRGDPESAGPASYMAGAVTALLDEPRSLAALHQELTRGRAVRVEAAGREAIAVIGMGCVMPGSPDVRAFFRDALRMRCFVRDVPPKRWERDLFLCEDRDEPLTSYSGIAGLVGEPDFDSAAFRIPPGVARSMDRSQKIALLAAREALRDGGYLDRAFDRDRAAVILGNSMGGDAADTSAGAIHLRRFRSRLEAVAAKEGLGEEAARLLEAYASRYGEGEIDEDTLPGELSNVIAGRVAWAFDLHGENFTVDAACASTLAAVGQAVEALRAGRANMVLTGGVDTQTDAGTFVKFSKLTALSARGSFPFDARGDGFVVGEGGAVFLLKRYPDALRDGDPVYGLIRGWGSSSDGSGQGITAPRSDTQVLAMRRAYQDAGADPALLAYVECHGTGTSLGDATEVASVSALRGSREAPLPIGSAKAMVGHLKAGAGAAGLLRALLAVHTRTVPPQVNFEEPRAELDLEAAGLRVPTRPEPLPDPGLVGLSSFGFGGTNFHMVLGPAPAGAREPVVDARRFHHADPGPLSGDTAWLFPGQGSQVVGMLEELRDAPLAGPFIERADATFQDLRREPLSPYLWPAEPYDRDEAQAALTDTAVAQPAIFLASAILLAHLEEQGLAPDMVIGHSLGEYGALYASGVLGFEEALRTVSLRGLSMKERGGEDAGTMAFLNCGPEAAGEVCAATPGYVVVANLNAYDQTVVAGDTEPVHDAVKRAMDAGIRARTLNVSAAFHSRLVADSAADMARHLEEVELRYPGVPIPANLTGRLYPRGEAGTPMSPEDKAETIELLKRQLAEPVDFVGQVELAYAAGIRRFVEVGPSDVLAKLVRGILQGKPFASLPLDGRKLDPREQLAGLGNALAAPLEIERRPVRAAPAVRSLRKDEAPVVRRAEPATTEEAVRAVIVEVTGYAPGDIPADADLERDLGIDTLKIFEIFSRLRRDVLPADTPNFRELTTVARIVGAAEAGADRAEATGDGALGRYRLVEAHGPVDSAPEAGVWEVVAGPGADSAAEELEGCLASGEGAGMAIALGRPSLDDLPRTTLPFLRDRLVAADPARPVRLVLAGSAPQAPRVRGALASFTRAARKDLRHEDLGLVDLGASPGADAEEWLARPGPEVRRGPGGELFTDRLESLRGTAPLLADLLGPEDLVVVSGGARGIAASCAQELLESTQARLLLLGRRPEVAEWIVAAGSDRVEYLSLDVTDAAAVEAADLASRGPTVLVHAAGMEVSRGLAQKPDEEIAATWEVKVAGARRLLDAVRSPALRAVVHFSSVAALFGNHGQADYAAANAALHPVDEEPPTLAIAWGPWRDVGMATRGPGAEAMEASGVRFLTPAEGRGAFRDLLARCRVRAPG
jgi:acyl transferase domain-containing protein